MSPNAWRIGKIEMAVFVLYSKGGRGYAQRFSVRLTRAAGG
jgi:hypothetical protein